MDALRNDGTFYVGDPVATSSDTAQRAHIKDRKLPGCASITIRPKVRMRGACTLTHAL